MHEIISGFKEFFVILDSPSTLLTTTHNNTVYTLHNSEKKLNTRREKRKEKCMPLCISFPILSRHFLEAILSLRLSHLWFASLGGTPSIICLPLSMLLSCIHREIRRNLWPSVPARVICRFPGPSANIYKRLKTLFQIFLTE